MHIKRFRRQLSRIKLKGEQQKARQQLIDKYSQYYPAKQRKVSNIMLTVIVIAVVGYSVADFILQYRTGCEISSTLTTCWFSFWGAEIVALTGIKVSKVLKAPNDKHVEDEDSLG